MPFRSAVLTAAVLTVLATSAVAGTVDLTATGDAMLFGNQHANEKWGDHYEMGVWWGSAREKPIVIFDVGSITSGSTITSAVLTMYVTGTGNPWNNSNNLPMDLYRVTESWVEGDVTWNQKSSGTSWGTGGGSYVGTTGVHEVSPYATSSASVSNVNDTVTWDVTDLVKEWHDGTSANHGLILMSRSPAGAFSTWNQMHFHTLQNKEGFNESPDPAYFPTLSVTVVPLPGAGIAGLGLLATMGAIGIVRRRRRVA